MQNTEIEYAVKLAKLAGERRTVELKSNRDSTSFGPLAADVIKLLRGDVTAGSAAKAWHGVIEQLAQSGTCSDLPAETT